MTTLTPDALAASSTAIPTPDATPPASSPGPDVTAAPSSGVDKPVEAPKTDGENLLSVVQDVVKPKTEEKTPDAADKTPEGEKAAEGEADKSETAKKEADETGDQDAPDPTAEELSKYSDKARDRIKQVIRQRKALEAEVAALKPAAENFQNLASYMRANNLSVEDTNLGLGLMALLRKGELQAFYDGVMPYIRGVEEALGVRLPDDVARQVEEGALSEAAARDLARTRAENARLHRTVENTTKAADADRQQVVATAVHSALANWEASVRTRDPDFDAKRNAMRGYAREIVAERGHPKTPEEAVEFAKLAYEQTNSLLNLAKPKPQPTRPVPSGVSTPGGTSAAPEPKGILDVVQQALARSRAGI